MARYWVTSTYTWTVLAIGVVLLVAIVIGRRTRGLSRLALLLLGLAVFVAEVELLRRFWGSLIEPISAWH